MNKSLTEKWCEGTLPLGGYYIKLLDGSIKQTDYDNISNTFDTEFFRYNVSVKEVLAPVPTYAEFKDLMSNLEYIDKYRELLRKTDKLEKQLAIATKALEEYANCKPTEWMSCVTADKALKEMEGVK